MLSKFAEHSIDGIRKSPMTEPDNNCKQKTIISTIRRKKLTLFGHICRMPDNRLLKSVLFGSMEGRSDLAVACLTAVREVLGSHWAVSSCLS